MFNYVHYVLRPVPEWLRGTAVYLDIEGGECKPRPGATKRSTGGIELRSTQEVNIADQNHLTLMYERTMYYANHQSAEQWVFCSQLQIPDYIPGSSPFETNAMRNQSKQELFLNSFLERLHLVEEAEELASNVLAASLLVVHNTGGGSQDNVTELTGGKELGSPLLEVTELNGVAGVDDTTLVETGEIKVSLIFDEKWYG